MTTYDHEELRSMVASYAIGALPEDEMPVIRDHILTCEECMQEADAYAMTASALALTVPSVPVPSGFADRILERVQEPRTAQAPEAPKRSWWMAPRVALAGVTLVALVLGVALVDATQDATDARRVAAALEQRIERNEEVLSAFVHSDDGWRLEGASGAVAQMVPTPGGATLAVAGLQEAPEGHVYQLWLLRGACGDQACAPTSAGLFEADEGVVVVPVERSVRNFAGAAVTLEPEGGSEAPTTEPLLSSV